MRRLLLYISCLFFVNANSQLPVINEIVTANITGLPDEYDIIPYNCPVDNCDQWYIDLGKSIYDGDYPGWVEIYNPGTVSFDLSGYRLTDDTGQPDKWIFPNISIPAKGYILVFLSGKNRYVNNPPSAYLHTNFKVNDNGEKLFLFSGAGICIDSIDALNIPIDFSYGRTTDGNSTLSTFIKPSPLTSNGDSIFAGYNDSISVSQKPGMYPVSISLTLTCKIPGSEIRYTTDGNDPVSSSSLYTAPVALDTPLTIKARVYKDGSFTSPVFCGSYLVNRNHTLPVVCVTTPPANLWDSTNGIYTPGENADEANRIANYWNDWERPARLELFENDGINSFSVDAGIKIFGWGSRTNDRKAFAVMLRNKYGTNDLNYKLFPDFTFTDFKSFVLRASGQDWQRTLIRDPLILQLTNNLDLDKQLFRHCVIYLNGQYWGIHCIQEKINEDYLNQHYDVDPDNVDIISRYWRRSFPIIIEGSDAAYNAMEDFLRTKNINLPQNYEYISGILDISNIIDYYAVNVFVANGDWPGNNNKCWKSNNPDSKWRHLMYDLDATFGYNSNSIAETNTLERATAEGGTGWPNPDFTTMIFRTLLKNITFRNRYVNRICDLMNSCFKPANINTAIDSFKTLLQPEIQKHIDKWGSYDVSLTNTTNWNNNIFVMKSFASARQSNVRIHMAEKFAISGWNPVTLAMEPAGAGAVKINSLTINNTGWSGIYAKNIPVTLSAMPLPGYRFVRWQGAADGDELLSIINVTLSTPQTITAIFETDENAVNKIIINEINYHSPVGSDAGDWIELYNAYGVPVDISGWYIKDSSESHIFKIPDYTILEPNAFLVICRDSVRFQQQNPALSNYTGEMNFGLENSGECIRLFNQMGIMIDSVHYDNILPWPTEADGNGSTLALLSPGLDNNDYKNWVAGINAGTPGKSNFPSGIKDYSVPELSCSVFPNPFTGAISIIINSPEDTYVDITIFDMQGRPVVTLFSGEIAAGKTSVSRNGENDFGRIIPAGPYILNVQTQFSRLYKLLIKI